MQVLEAAMASNIMLRPRTRATPRASEQAEGARGLVRLAVALVMIGLFVVALGLASAKASVVKTEATGEARGS